MNDFEIVARRKASLALVIACLLWGMSFPLMKTLNLRTIGDGFGLSTWFVAAIVLCLRFGVAALVLVFVRVERPTRVEFEQGLALGAFTSAGMILQMDALSFTQASTSAFLTQGYVFMLPFLSGVAARRWPPLRVVLCAFVALIGLAVLSNFDWRQFRLARGEAETLLAAFFFAFQILWLDKAHYASNRTGPVTLVMFASMALSFLGIGWANTEQFNHDLAVVIGGPAIWLLLAVLTVCCTLATFSLMNRFQRYLSASEAGVIYCVEPLFASLYALFLPDVLSRFTGVIYENEVLTVRWVMGGGLVLMANLLLNLPSSLLNTVRKRPLFPRDV